MKQHNQREYHHQESYTNADEQRWTVAFEKEAAYFCLFSTINWPSATTMMVAQIVGNWIGASVSHKHRCSQAS
jgi:hypothetical protein